MAWAKLLIVLSALIYATSATYYYPSNYPRPSYRPNGNKETVKPVTEDIKEADEDSSEAHSTSVESDKETDFSNEEDPSFYYRPYFVPYEEDVKEQSTPISTVAQPVLPAKLPVAVQEGHSGHNVNSQFGHHHSHPGGNVVLAGSIATNLGPHSVHQPVRPYRPHGYTQGTPVHGGLVPHGHVNHHPPGGFAAAGAIATNFGHPSFHYVPGSYASLGPVYHRPNYHVPNYHLPPHSSGYHGGYRPQGGSYHPVYYGHRENERADLQPVFVINGLPHLHASGSLNLNHAGANVEGGLITSPGHPITFSVAKPEGEGGVRGPPEPNNVVQLINKPFEVLGTISHPPTDEVVRHPENPVVHHTDEPTNVHHEKLPAHNSEMPYPTLYYPSEHQNGYYYYYPNPYGYHPDKEVEDAAPAASELAATTTAAAAAPAAAVNKKPEVLKKNSSSQFGKGIPIDAVEVTANSAAAVNKKPEVLKKNSSSQFGKGIPIDAVEVTANSGVEKPVVAVDKAEVVDGRSGDDQNLAANSAPASGEASTTAAPVAEEKKEKKKEAASARSVDLLDEPFAAFGPVADDDDEPTMGQKSSQEFVDNDKTIAKMQPENDVNSVNEEEPVTKSSV